MSARAMMTQRAATERAAEMSDGGGGYSETYVSYLPSEPCWYSPIGNAETIFSSQMGTNPTSRVFMAKDTDVNETDRIVVIKDRLGRTVVQGPLRVEAVIKRLNHVELYCTARKS